MLRNAMRESCDVWDLHQNHLYKVWPQYACTSSGKRLSVFQGISEIFLTFIYSSLKSHSGSEL